MFNIIILLADEIYRQLIDANVKFVITQPDILSKVKEAIRKTGKDLPLMVVKTRVRSEEVIMKATINKNLFSTRIVKTFQMVL